MNATESCKGAVQGRLILFHTGDAPRSRRARDNLAQALERLGLRPDVRDEVDLIVQPEKGVRYGVFATPALVRVVEGDPAAVLYGDLSDASSLERFLAAVGPGEHDPGTSRPGRG